MKYARVELRPPSGSDFGDKPKYNVFMKYARVELRPPSELSGNLRTTHFLVRIK